MLTIKSFLSSIAVFLLAAIIQLGSFALAGPNSADGPDSRTANFSSQLSQARANISDGLYSDAISVASGIIDSNLSSEDELLEALRLRGSARLRLGDFLGAEADLTSVLRSQIDDVWALWQRCWANTQIGALAAARRDCDVAERLIRKNPQLDPDGLAMRAIVSANAEWLRISGRPAAALGMLDSVAELPGDHKDWRTIVQLANTRRTAGDYVGAIDALNEALDHAPGSWIGELYKSRAELNILLGRFDWAEIDLTEALRIEPENIGTMHQLCLIQLSMGAHSIAIENCSRTYEYDPQDAAYAHNYGLALIRNSEFLEAKEITERVLSENPDNLNLLVNLYLSLLGLGDNIQASSVLEEIRSNPRD